MIEEKAQEIGRMIGQSNEYQSLRRAEKAMHENESAKQKLETISKLTREFDTMVAEGKQPTEEQAKEYEDTLRAFEASTEGQGYLVARANVDKLMNRVNKAIGEGIERGATSGIITL